MYIPIFSKDVNNFLNKKVSVIGKIVDIKEERKYIDFVLLDPFGYIIARSFEPQDIDLFSSVIILGKVREFKGNRYIAINYITKFNQEEEIFWRKRHLDIYKKLSTKKIFKKEKEEGKKTPKEEEKEIIKTPKSNKELRNIIIKAIKELDKGDGVTIDQIAEYLDIDKSVVEKVVEELLLIGEIYEVSLGKLKVVE